MICRMRLRIWELRSGEKFSSAIIVEPLFSRFETRDDQVTCGHVMFGYVLIREDDLEALRVMRRQ